MVRCNALIAHIAAPSSRVVDLNRFSPQYSHTGCKGEPSDTAVSYCQIHLHCLEIRFRFCFKAICLHSIVDISVNKKK